MKSKDKTNAMRALDARKITYEVYTFPPEIHSAAGVAEVVGLPPEQVYKTLVVLRPEGKPMLVIIAGDKELDLRQVASQVGEKKVRMALHREAEELTGLQVGGISALALLNRPFDVFIDRPATGLSHILVSAGKRGINLRVPVKDLIRITGARVIDAGRSPDEGS
jgi:Cys-tRNA(Pro)/Cys-tRNA(Cys) deacylase